MDGCSFAIGQSRHEVDGDGSDDFSVEFGDVEEIAFIEVEGLDIVQILVISLWKPSPTEDIVAGADNVLDSWLVGASGESDLHARSLLG